MDNFNEWVNSLSNTDVTKYVRSISNDEYIDALATVNQEGQDKLLSVLSESAKLLMLADLSSLGIEAYSFKL